MTPTARASRRTANGWSEARRRYRPNAGEWERGTAEVIDRAATLAVSCWCERSDPRPTPTEDVLAGLTWACHRPTCQPTPTEETTP